MLSSLLLWIFRLSLQNIVFQNLLSYFLLANFFSISSLSMRIDVGLPCGQVNGFGSLSNSASKLSTSSFVSAIFAFTAALHAIVAMNFSSISCFVSHLCIVFPFSSCSSSLAPFIRFPSMSVFAIFIFVLWFPRILLIVISCMFSPLQVPSISIVSWLSLYPAGASISFMQYFPRGRSVSYFACPAPFVCAFSISVSFAIIIFPCLSVMSSFAYSPIVAPSIASFVSLSFFSLFFFQLE